MKIANIVLLMALTSVEAKKANPWKKTVGQPKLTPSEKIWADLTKRVSGAIVKVKKYANAETILAVQVNWVLLETNKQEKYWSISLGFILVQFST